MMCRCIILLIGFPFSLLFAQKKEKLQFNYQMVYRVSYQTDSNDVSSRKQRNMELLLNDEMSLFQSINRGQQDSIFFTEKKTRTAALLMAPVNKLNYQILKRGAEIKTYDSAFGINLQGVDEIYYYDEPRDMLEWQIKQDTLRIGNLFCQRADVHFGGRHWIAWFAPEIPIPDGPYKFCGLPGLIVSIADTKGHWQFDLTNIRNVEKVVVLNFQSWYKFVPATKERLFRERKEFQDNLVANMEASGADFSHPASPEYTHERGRIEYSKLLANDNNWIERYP
ncbi:GLPGLI family protein [Parapedobacter luteus]|uniref:GLPGLI family protein n=1 Tax=Parapedobacter luteus TaxID=623280 RepID=A0A1T4ZUI7_9SPHI|nr:GLPGLI family protein [Parapedobacter luteus]SKB26444.1 GLPGLI family protein [Parapedobacter luteus]